MEFRPETAPPPAREAIPTTSYPSRRVDEATTRAAATLGKSLVVSGHITGKEDLLVDGRMEGDIDLPENRLTVGFGGHVEGKIRAREVVVYGSVHGNMESTERVEIKRNAKVIGDLKTARPVIEDEAYFKGNVETIRVDPPKLVKPAASAAAASASSPTSSSTDTQQPLIGATTEAKPGPEPRRG